jgi:flagellar assembly protein FliH
MTTSAAAPARFTFDLDLGRREERNRLISEAALAEIRQEARMAGFAEGYAEGRSGVEAQAAQLIAAAAEAIADRGAAFTELLDDAKATIRSDAAELCREIARKLASNLIARQPEAELMTLFEECLQSLKDVPHLVVRCHPSLADRIREGAEARIAAAGFEGRLVVIGDREEALSDGRIEWADGGLTRDLAAISAAIDTAIGGYLTTHGKTTQ